MYKSLYTIHIHIYIYYIMHIHARTRTHMTFKCAPAPRSSTINRSSLVSPRRSANLALNGPPKHTTAALCNTYLYSYVYIYIKHIPNVLDE